MKILTILTLMATFVSADAFAVRANGGLLKDKNGTIIGTTAFGDLTLNAKAVGTNAGPGIGPNFGGQGGTYLTLPCNVPPAQCKRLCEGSFYNGTYNSGTGACDNVNIKKTNATN